MRAFFTLCCIVFMALPLSALALVNINTAGSSELQTLNGIGPSKAQAILDYRTQNGPFVSIEEIQNVSGIGAVTYGNIKDFITVGDTPQAAQQATTTQESTTAQTQSQAQTASAGPVSSYVPPPEPYVFADAGKDRTVIVGADTDFAGRAYNKAQQTLDKVRFLWNFGDGSTAEGATVRHHYDYPGRYAVVLDIAAGVEAASDEAIITAEPAKLSFAVHPDGSVSIGNEAGRDLDLSGWLVRSFNTFFTLPEHSVILSGETMRIPQKTLKFWAGAHTELDYPNGVAVPLTNESPAPKPMAVPPAPEPVSAPVYRAPPPSVEVVEEPETVATATAQVSQTAAAGAVRASGLSLWWLGALAIAFLGGIAVVVIRRLKSGEWDIEEA